MPVQLCRTDQAHDGGGTFSGAKWGSAFKKGLHEEFTHTASFNGHTTSLPLASNNVTLDPEVKDKWGRPALRTTFLEALCESGSDLVILPIQDVFGWRARINQPATVSARNWTWKLPWPSNRLLAEPEAVDVAEQLRQCAVRHGRA